MKWEQTLAVTTLPSGARLSLHLHDGTYAIRLNGQTLMNSAQSASELLLGQLALARVSASPSPRVLIGGLGLGFSLASVLAHSPATVAVQVAELLPQVLEWNRTWLLGLNGRLVDDPRVQILIEDVWTTLSRCGPHAYQAILLDIDNGPTAMVQQPNARLYSPKGIQRLWDALCPAGRAAIWSAAPDREFAQRLAVAGFTVEAVAAKLYPQAKRAGCTIYLADKRPPNR